MTTAACLTSCVAAVGALVGPAQALPSPFLVRDINTAPVIFSSAPRQLATVGERVFFVADTPSGPALWRSDGSAAGTALVKRIDVVGNLVAASGALFFVASEPDTGAELWRSDGTAAGTALVRDINPGPAGAFDVDERINSLAVVGDVLLFAAYDGLHGALWRSDGTASGTTVVKTIGAAELTAVGDAVFFTAEDGAHGRALWKTDGTPAGTVLVRDFADDAEGTPEQLTASGGRLFFLIGNDRNAQLWVSDGTTSGTVQLRGAFFGSDLTDVDGMLYFTTATRLLKSDGTVEGTVVVGDFHPVSGQYTPRQLTAVGADLFFSAELGTDGVRLFVVGAHSGALRGLDKFKSNDLTSAAGRLFFVVGDATYGVELWTSDGTVAGTRLVRDVNPGTASSDPTGLSADGDRLLFRACDAERCALWTSDGSEAATRPLADLGSLGASSFVRLGALVFFTASNIEVGAELWAVSLSDGCAGDCDGDGVVTIAELIHLVALALGESGAAECAGAGRDDGEVSINDLVAAVDNALVGCGSAVPTPSMTPTATPTNPPGCCFCAPRTPAAQTASFTDCLHTPNCGWYDDPCHCGNFCP